MICRPTPLPMLRYADAEGRAAYVAADQVVRITAEGEGSTLWLAGGEFLKTAQPAEELAMAYHDIVKGA